jgi:N utilization substance protein A
MTRIKYSADLMKYMSFFEALTTVKLKDCFTTNSQLVFVVQEGQAGKAIGKNGYNAKKIEKALKKKIKIMEFDTDVTKFVSNLIYPLKAKEVREENGLVTIIGGDVKTKALLIGRNSQNLQSTEEILRRYFHIKGIRVI